MAGRRVRIGPWRADEASDTLICGETRTKLERRAMATLLLLVDRAGEVVPREEILEKVWRGLHVSDHSVAIVISDLRRALGDDRQEPRFIETITKRGYRLIAPVEPEASEAPRPILLARRPAMAALVLGLAGATAASLWAFGSGESVDQSAPIYVEDISGPERGPAAGHIEFAIGDMIAATLAQASGAPVVRLRGRGNGPLDRGRMVSGRTLAQGDDRLLLLQVSNAANGEVIWAENYLVAPSRLAPRSLEVARDVARALGLAAPGQAVASIGPEAYERYWRARYLWDRRQTESIRAARMILEQLIEDEPGFAAAHAALADIYAHKSGEELGMPRLDTFVAARRHLRAARSLGPPTSEVHATEAVLAFYADRDFAAARRAAQRAVELAPGRPAGWQVLAMVESATGDRAASIAAIDRAHLLDPGSMSIVWDRAWHLYIAGRHRDALAAAEAARRTGQSVSLLVALLHDAAGQEEAAFRAWLQRAGDAGVDAAELAMVRRLADRGLAYRRLAEAVRSQARPPRPVIAALLFVKAGQPAAAAESLDLARQGRSDWMTAWTPRMRQFRALRTGGSA